MTGRGKCSRRTNSFILQDYDNSCVFEEIIDNEVSPDFHRHKQQNKNVASKSKKQRRANSDGHSSIKQLKSEIGGCGIDLISCNLAVETVLLGDE